MISRWNDLLIGSLILSSCLSRTISSVRGNWVSIILCLIVKILLSVWCNRVDSCNTLIKITTIIHHLFLVRGLPYLILNILYSWLARALCWLLVWVSPWWRCLLTLWIEIYWIINILRHHIIIHHSTGIHVILYDLFSWLSYVVVIVAVLIFSIFRGFFLLFHFDYLLSSTLIHFVTVYYYIVSIFLWLLCHNLIVWSCTVLRKQVLSHALHHFLVLVYLFWNVVYLLVFAFYICFILYYMLVRITLIILIFINFVNFYCSFFILKTLLIHLIVLLRVYIVIIMFWFQNLFLNIWFTLAVIIIFLLNLLFNRQSLRSPSWTLGRANLILLRRAIIIFTHFTAFALLHNLNI